MKKVIQEVRIVGRSPIYKHLFGEQPFLTDKMLRVWQLELSWFQHALASRVSNQGMLEDVFPRFRELTRIVLNDEADTSKPHVDPQRCIFEQVKVGGLSVCDRFSYSMGPVSGNLLKLRTQMFHSSSKSFPESDHFYFMLIATFKFEGQERDGVIYIEEKLT